LSVEKVEKVQTCALWALIGVVAGYQMLKFSMSQHGKYCSWKVLFSMATDNKFARYSFEKNERDTNKNIQSLIMNICDSLKSKGLILS